jgi:hypothetical protein
MLIDPKFEGISTMENIAPNPQPNNRPKVITQNELSKAKSFWTIQDLKNIYATAPDDVVMGFASPNLTMLQGKAGSGKSIVALEMVAAYTTGTPFLGVAEVSVNPERPAVAYFDQDNFSHKVLINRMLAFGVDEDKVIVPQGSLLLDNPESYEAMATLIKDNKVGLTILDSAHAFHKLRDRRLDLLRDGFKALIDAGSAVVILSHITKSGNADDSNSAEGSGLPAACDYIWGLTEEERGRFRMVPVKVRQSSGSEADTVLVTFDGFQRPEYLPEVTLEEQILEFVTEAGDKGTNVGEIRSAVSGGKDKVKEAIASLGDELYCDGKRGPGNHIWLGCYKPESPIDESTLDIDDSNLYADDEDEAMVVSA